MKVLQILHTSKLSAFILILILGLSGPLLIKGKAFAATGGYPWSGATCVATGKIEGRCPNFEWRYKGSVKNPTTGNYYYRNCTDYVAWKLTTLGVSVSKLSGLGNAGMWDNNAPAKGLKVSTTPSAGSVGVDERYGHVVYVEKVSGSTLTISEYNWGSAGIYGVRSGTASDLYLSKFINFGVNSYKNITDGNFVKTASSDEAYEIVGNAALPISNWKRVGGPQPVITISSSQLQSFSKFPINGKFVKAYGNSTVYMTVGNSLIPLSSWNEVGASKKVTTIANNLTGTYFKTYPQDGTYVQPYGSKTVYIIAGGFPFAVSSWNAISGTKSFTVVPKNFATKLSTHPVKGTYIRGFASKRVYQSSGSSLQYISSWLNVGGTKTSTSVDDWAINKLLN